MRTDKENTTTRRRWFLTGLRWGVGGLMAVTVGFFARRRQISDETACVDPKGRLGCRSCALLQDCGLPRGLSVKQYLQKQHGKAES